MYLLCYDFSSCSESTEIWHANSFCKKKSSCCFFFSGRQKNMDKIAQNCPLPLSLSVSKQFRILILKN